MESQPQQQSQKQQDDAIPDFNNTNNIQLNLLEYEKHIIQDFNQYQNCLLVLARGFSVTKQVANFLFQYRKTYDCGNNTHSSPFLIFLVNFSKTDYHAIEYYLKQFTNQDENDPIMLTRIASDDSLTNKRIDMYLKGGIFSVSYKALVLDLLTKRLSPSIISGFVINNAHNVEEQSSESFLCKILRRDNPDNAFIKCISDYPNSVARGSGMFGIEALMKSLQVNNLLLYPRIRKSIKDSLDNVKQVKVIENSLKFTKRMDEMHTILIELLAACLDELKSQIKKFDNLQGEPNEVLEPQKALLNSFGGVFRNMMGKNQVYLGEKAHSLLDNIDKIKRMIWILLNQDCVQFYIFLNDLRSENLNASFSIFKYSDEETTINIEKLLKLSKERIMSTVFKQTNDSDEEENDDLNQDTGDVENFDNKNLLKQQSKKKKRQQLDIEYGKLVDRHQIWWSKFQDKAYQNIEDIKQYEKDYEFIINFENSPKMQSLIQILVDAENQFKKTSKFKEYQNFELKRLHKNNKKGNIKQKGKKLEEDELHGKQAENALYEKEQMRQVQNRNILIPIKVMKRKNHDKDTKIQRDIEKFLIHYFVKNNQGKGFFEEKLRYYLSSYQECQKRESIMLQKRPCNLPIIDAYYQQKLSLHLEQKLDWQFQKHSRFAFNNRIDSKKRFRNEISGAENQNIQLNYHNANLTEDVIQELSEEFFKYQNIINGFNIHIMTFDSNSEYELALRNLDPQIVILYEPYLEFMRGIEIYNAERVQFSEQQNDLESIEVHFMMYEDSAEFYQYMNIVEIEKKGFQKLLDIKSKLYIELKDFKIENEIKALEQKDKLDNSRKGGYKNLNSNNVEDIDRDIIVVDSREFTSTTPIHLYEKGFWLIPITIEVGDYILSEDICIERKSAVTGDLFSSFQSGRLLKQITNMVRFYKRPMLLIEFDESKPFKLTDQVINKVDTRFDTAAGGDINPGHIISKISLLTLHFPTLQIIWSKSPLHTAEIFKELKRTQTGLSKDPDLQKIAKIGKVGDLSGDNDAYYNEDNKEDDEFNRFMPSEFLKKLPGIDSNNINILTSRVRNMVELCQMEEDELKKYINPRNAKELKTFLTKKIEVKNNDEQQDEF